MTTQPRDSGSGGLEVEGPYKINDVLIVGDADTDSPLYSLLHDERTVRLANAAHQAGIQQGREAALKEVDEAAKELDNFTAAYGEYLDDGDNVFSLLRLGVADPGWLSGATFTDVLFAATPSTQEREA